MRLDVEPELLSSAEPDSNRSSPFPTTYAVGCHMPPLRGWGWISSNVRFQPWVKKQTLQKTFGEHCGLRSGSAPELDDSPAIAFGWSACGQLFELLHRLALRCYLQAQFLACLRLAVERLGN
jgi:hypothetical protein